MKSPKNARETMRSSKYHSKTGNEKPRKKSIRMQYTGSPKITSRSPKRKIDNKIELFNALDDTLENTS
jgi:hypothetical protein